MDKLRPEYNNELSILSNGLNIPIGELTTYLEQEINKRIGIDPSKLLTVLINKMVNVDIRKSRQWLRTMMFVYMGDKKEEITKDNSINIIPLYNKFRQEGFSGSDVDKYLIEEIALCILGQPHITAKQIAETCEAIMDYMLQNGERTYDRFIYYLMKSKLVKEKCNIDLDTLKAKVEKELEEIKKCH